MKKRILHRFEQSTVQKTNAFMKTLINVLEKPHSSLCVCMCVCTHVYIYVSHGLLLRGDDNACLHVCVEVKADVRSSPFIAANSGTD